MHSRLSPSKKEDIVNIKANILELVGNTPLVRLNKIVEGAKAEVVVKLESRNPLSDRKRHV